MIIRARPKYYEDSKARADSSFVSVKYGEELYLNSGRAALLFLLRCHSAFSKAEQPVILMQSFNCEVVADAAIQAGYDVLLMDIDLSSFSITFDEFRSIDLETFDVLLLTHYQGIPNPDYIKIIEYCRNNNILVIEDMAHSYGSCIDDVMIGTLGHAAIFSYAFDKPFSVYAGGGLVLNDVDESLKQNVLEAFDQLDVESVQDAKCDLRALNFMYAYSSASKYKKVVNNQGLVRRLAALATPNIMVYWCAFIFEMPLRLFNKIKRKLFPNDDSTKKAVIPIKRMHSLKVAEVQRQKTNFYVDQAIAGELYQVLNDKGVSGVNIPNAVIHWNRFAVLDEGGVMQRWCNKVGLEASNCTSSEYFGHSA